MPGTLTVSTLSDGTNSTSATNAIKGSAKVWANFNGTNASVYASYNISSVTRGATGDYIAYFTNSMSSASYSVFFSGDGDAGNQRARTFGTYTVGIAGSQRINCWNPAAGAAQDPVYAYMGVFGN